ncbi:MAG: N-methyl-D-aspartate receptor NMDAR2C subunit [Gemmatimonadales bacterium]
MAQPRSLDRSRWIGLWNRLGAQGDGISVFARLEAAYAEPARVYHTAEHIRDCLAQFDLGRHLAERPDEVEAATWFHDAVYQPGASDNEDQSARLARTSLADARGSLEVAHRIADLVLATQHLSIPGEPDAALLCDIDLSILGRIPELFDRFEQRIRQEYAWVPEAIYQSARAEILEGFLGRRFIYQTDFFRDRYEVQARVNLTRVIAELGAS